MKLRRSFVVFSRAVNPLELRPPAWDISLVLQSLTGAPYEPLRTCEERFLAQKTFLNWPLPRLSVSVSYTLCRTESLIPGTGVRFPFLLSRVLWPRLRIPPSLAPRFEGFSVPALPNARNNRNGRLLCPVWAVRVYLDRHCSTSSRDVNGSLSPQGVARRRLRRPRSPSGSGRQYPRAYELSGTALPVPAPPGS